MITIVPWFALLRVAAGLRHLATEQRDWTVEDKNEDIRMAGTSYENIEQIIPADFRGFRFATPPKIAEFCVTITSIHPGKMRNPSPVQSQK